MLLEIPGIKIPLPGVILLPEGTFRYVKLVVDKEAILAERLLPDEVLAGFENAIREINRTLPLYKIKTFYTTYEDLAKTTTLKIKGLWKKTKLMKN